MDDSMPPTREALVTAARKAWMQHPEGAASIRHLTDGPAQLPEAEALAVTFMELDASTRRVLGELSPHSTLVDAVLAVIDEHRRFRQECDRYS